jgi:hypothetical protein
LDRVAWIYFKGFFTNGKEAVFFIAIEGGLYSVSFSNKVGYWLIKTFWMESGNQKRKKNEKFTLYDFLFVSCGIFYEKKFPLKFV